MTDRRSVRHGSFMVLDHVRCALPPPFVRLLLLLVYFSSRPYVFHFICLLLSRFDRHALDFFLTLMQLWMQRIFRERERNNTHQHGQNGFTGNTILISALQSTHCVDRRRRRRRKLLWQRQRRSQHFTRRRVHARHRRHHRMPTAYSRYSSSTVHITRYLFHHLFRCVRRLKISPMRAYHLTWSQPISQQLRTTTKAHRTPRWWLLQTQTSGQMTSIVFLKTWFRVNSVM